MRPRSWFIRCTKVTHSAHGVVHIHRRRFTHTYVESYLEEPDGHIAEFRTPNHLNDFLLNIRFKGFPSEWIYPPRKRRRSEWP